MEYSNLFKSYIDVIKFHREKRGNQLALIEIPNLKDAHRKFTYAQIDRRCRAIAAHLQTLNVKGERALLAFDNDADYLFAFLGCIYAGVVSVTLFAPSQRKHVERFASVSSDCGARLILTNSVVEARSPSLGMTRKSFPNLSWVLCDQIDDSLSEKWLYFSPAPSDLAYLQYTSGSTGSPRGVMVMHQNLMYQGRYIENQMQVRPTDRALSWLPLYHDMGLIAGALQPLFSGTPLWLSNPTAALMHPERWLKAISDLRITHSGAPNFFYDLCADTVELDGLQGADLSCFSVAYNGAEPVRAASIERFTSKFSALGLPVSVPHPAYGLAEATLVVSMKTRAANTITREVDAEMLERNVVMDSVAGRTSRMLVANGKPTLETLVRVVDPHTGRVCAHDRIGEIWVSGPTVGRGYWNKSEATERTFKSRIGNEPEDYLRTGDLGFMDAENNLYITGRLKDLIVIAGRNHYPQDIEETVEQLGAGIRKRGVVALGVERDGIECLVLLAEIDRPGACGIDIKALSHRVRYQIAAKHDLQILEIVFLIPAQLPMTTSGKIRRRACYEKYLAGEFKTLVHSDAQ